MLFVNIGSKNPQKINAVCLEFPAVTEVHRFTNHDVPSGISEQPMALAETYEGAMNRAIEAMQGISKRCLDMHTHETSDNVFIGVGLESGLIEPPFEEASWMDITVCAMRAEYPSCDVRWAFGLSKAFAVPDDIMQVMLDEGCDMSAAAALTGYCDDRGKIGEAEGIIGILSEGRTNRCEQLRSAVQMALLHLDKLL